MTAIYWVGRAGDAWKSRSTHVAALIAWIACLFREWHYRSEIHKLQGMSDRQLSDMGLTRSRIEDAVRSGRA